MSSYSYKKHKRTKHSKKSKHHVRRKTRKMRGGSDIGIDIKSGSENRYVNPINTSQGAGCSSDNRTGIGAYYLNTPRVVGGQSGGGGSVCTQNPYQFSGVNNNQSGGITFGYVDIDNNSSTFMSSSDSMNLPICSEVAWAGLYWSARIQQSTTDYASRNQVKLKVIDI